MAVQNNYKAEFLDEYSKLYHVECLERLKSNAENLTQNINDFDGSKLQKHIVPKFNSLDNLNNNTKTHKIANEQIIAEELSRYNLFYKVVILVNKQ